MCGIAGYYGSGKVPAENIRMCLATMRRRGPDHAGTQEFSTPGGRCIHLLHTRLSIIDIDTRSNQPFTVRDRTAVYNGEIYNYLELRRELEAAGYRFHTTSDTEVLLTALDAWGDDAFERCEGMWASAVWNVRTQELVLARDRFGEKPLYYLEADDGVYFASEIKAIFALRGRAQPFDLEHLSRYLVADYKLLYKQDASFFAGVKEIPAAHLLTLSRGNKELRRYWRLELRQDRSMSYATAVQKARAALVDSIRIRLRADVPLAFSLSGGIDSTALISLASRELGFDVHAFSIVNSDQRYDERTLVDATVRELGIRYTPVPVEFDDFLGRLRQLIRYHDAPVYTISYFAHWRLMEHVATAGYRVIISGTAADELFSGYYDHHLAYFYDIRHDSRALQAARRAWEQRIRPAVRNRHLSDPDLFIRDPGFRDHLTLDSDRYRSFLKDKVAHPFTEQEYAPELLRNRMLNELFHENVPVILHEEDLNAMYWSVENRAPFLDRRLFEACSTIPTRHLIQDGRAKAILRDAVRGVAPEPVIDNPVKVGFNAPIESYLDLDDPKTTCQLLDNTKIFEFVQRDKIEAFIGGLKPPLANSDSKFLFRFISASMFLEEFAA